MKINFEKLNYNDFTNIVSELESEVAEDIKKELLQLSHNLFRMGYRSKAKYAIIYGLGKAEGERQELARHEKQQ